jgi:hypothetical protein
MAACADGCTGNTVIGFCHRESDTEKSALTDPDFTASRTIATWHGERCGCAIDIPRSLVGAAWDLGS